MTNRNYKNLLPSERVAESYRISTAINESKTTTEIEAILQPLGMDMLKDAFTYMKYTVAKNDTKKSLMDKVIFRKGREAIEKVKVGVNMDRLYQYRTRMSLQQ
jgi:hypothetical protein